MQLFSLLLMINDRRVLSSPQILKDQTRRTIIIRLNDNGHMSYVELMKSAEVNNTGRFNYHLKVLAALLEKQSDGGYVLTERDRLAVQLLDKFP